MKRKITSILAADVVEFSRLVATDEEDTLARLVSAQAVFGAHVSGHGGRIFNTAGDAILAEFPSAVEAVRAAVAIQDGWRAVDCDAPDDRRLWFRMGIGIGDVMEHGADLLGDGVNIAARLQGLAPAGGIAVSHWVQEQIAGKVNLPLIDIGEQDLKNIPKPVRVSIIDRSGLWSAPATKALQTSLVMRGRTVWAAHTAPQRLTSTRTYVGLTAALAVAIGAVLVLRPKRPQLVTPPPTLIGTPPSLPTAPPPELAGVPGPVAPGPVAPGPVSPPTTPAAPAVQAPTALPAGMPDSIPVPTALPLPLPLPLDRDGPILAPPVVIDAPDLASSPPPALPTPIAAPPTAPVQPLSDTADPKRLPIRPPQSEPKRLLSIEKKTQVK